MRARALLAGGLTLGLGIVTAQPWAQADDKHPAVSSPTIAPESPMAAPPSISGADTEQVTAWKNSDGTQTIEIITAPSGAALRGYVPAVRAEYVRQGSQQVGLYPSDGGSHGCDLCGTHWERFNTTHAVMYAQDFTGSAWPVYNSVINWNKSTSVDQNYVSPSSSCSFHCVSVKETHAGGSYYGITYFDRDNNNHFVPGHESILLNDDLGNARDHAITACQELGHVLGLDHQYDTLTSCMHSPHNASEATTPNSTDYSSLSTIYNH